MSTSYTGIMPLGLDEMRAVWCDVYVDITDVIERKVAALDLMRGQGYDGPYARKRAEAVDGHFGLVGGVAYAEAFYLHASPGL